MIAFTDWEFAHLGDPMEDWAYLITIRGARRWLRATGSTLFERVAGVTVTDRELHYWSVFNFFKGACANLTCRRVFRTSNPAPNMALHRHCAAPDVRAPAGRRDRPDPEDLTWHEATSRR